jgi:purine-binding chemotaxis protein CheW
MKNHTANNDQYVIFKLENEFYGIPINFVETIERVLEITRVPNTPSYVKGVINLRGEVVPVVDLRKRFKLSDKKVTEESRIIILSIEEVSVGLLVDNSSEVLTIPVDSIDNTSNLVNSFEDDYIKGIGKVENRMIIIIDIPRILGISIDN